jgi:hypothetical protein
MFEDVKSQIRSINKKYVKEYDNTKQIFNVGDELYCSYFGEPVKVKITEVIKDNYFPNGYVFYFVRNSNISKSELFWEEFKFYLWHYILSRFKIKPFKYSGKLGPGHGLKVGLGEELFETKEEALIDHYCHCILGDLIDLENNIKIKKGELENE